MTAPTAAEPVAMTDNQAHPSPTAAGVFRVEVRARPGQPDPHGHALLTQARQTLGNIAAVHTARVYLIQAPLDDEQAQTIAEELLSDPINQVATLGATPVDDRHSMVEVHYQPGVMDPVAQSTKSAIREMFPDMSADDLPGVEVRTGFRYDFDLTADNGKEFAGFASLERGQKLKVYFANPHAPRERGANENTNGLLREFFPKGSDFRRISNARLARVEQLLNNRPRKSLNYRTPREVLNALPGVALRN